VISAIRGYAPTMRSVILAISLAGSLLVVSGAPAQSGHARVWLDPNGPSLLVRGSGFDPGRMVSVRVTFDKGALGKAVRASSSGTFAARFTSVPAGACAIAIVARDSLGRTAHWKSPPESCGTLPADLSH
jgi:hypothetical protein